MYSYDSCVCHKCFRNLALEDSEAAILWMDLCDKLFYEAYLWLPNAILEVTANFDKAPVLRHLEKRGFLVSLDHGKFLRIKLKGYSEGVFCLESEGHD